MSGLIIALIIVVFLMHRHHQKRFRRRYYYRTGEGPCSYGGKMGEDIVNDAMRKIGDHFGRHFDQADKHARDFERHADIPPVEEEEKRYQTYEERQAYRRARIQAAREAGFYKHL